MKKNMNKKIQNFQEVYQNFIDNRNHLLNVIHLEKRKDETNPEFCIRIGQFYDIHIKNPIHDNLYCDQCKLIDNYYDVLKLFDNTLKIGRRFVFLFHNPSFLSRCHEYLIDRGYRELADAYFFCAPIDAILYLYKINNNYSKDNIKLDNWFNIMFVNNESKCSVYHQFLLQYKNIYQQFKSGLLDDNPYPINDMRIICLT